MPPVDVLVWNFVAQATIPEAILDAVNGKAALQVESMNEVCVIVPGVLVALPGMVANS